MVKSEEHSVKEQKRPPKTETSSSPQAKAGSQPLGGTPSCYALEIRFIKSWVLLRAKPLDVDIEVINHNLHDACNETHL